MAFAVSLCRGEAKVKDCPFLGQEERALLNRVRPFDWKRELINKMREEASRLDFAGICDRIGAVLQEDGSLRLTCLGRPYRVTPEGDVLAEDGRDVNPWVNILILHYLRSGGSGNPTGKWVDFSELKSGMLKVASFRRDCEEPLGELFDKYRAGVEEALQLLGAVRVKDAPTADAWVYYILPKVPLLLLYWPGEDGEGSRLKILWDSSADRFLDVESLIFATEGLVHTIQGLLRGRVKK